MPAHLKNQRWNKTEKAYLEFDGAAMTADVFVNGAELFHHEGGYSRFRVDVTEHLKEQNQLEVLVDNSDNTKVYPQKADFTFYGGLYRMVKLVTVPENHFCMEYAGSNGIKVTPEVTILDAGAKKADAEVTVELWIEGKSADVMVTVGGEKKSVPVESMDMQKQCLILPMYISGMAWMIRIYIRQKRNCLMETAWRQPLDAEVFPLIRRKDFS